MLARARVAPTLLDRYIEPMRGRGERALAALAVAWALACGDPGDIEVPWAPGVAQREALPTYRRLPPSAFAKLEVVDAAGVDGACAVHFASSLGQPCAQLETDEATCVPVREGESASVSCTVSPLLSVPGVYDLQLELKHEFLPMLTVNGPLAATRESRISLHVTPPSGPPIDADCNADTLDIQPGVARFRASRCAIRIDATDAPGCELSLTAGADGCFVIEPSR